MNIQGIKLKIIILILFLGNLKTYGQNTGLDWATRIGGVSLEESRSIGIDAAGNVYTLCYYGGLVDFDPGAGEYHLSSGGSAILKMDAAGNFIWARDVGSTNNVVGESMYVDPAGNVYSTGFFMGTADFDPGPGVFNLTSLGNYDIFLSKIDAQGNLVFAKSMGGSSQDVGLAITLDHSGNIYMSGYFWGSADLNPGAGAYNPHTSVGGEDIFVVKLNNNGDLIWVKTMGGPAVIGTYYDRVEDIEVDQDGNVYLVGYFDGTTDFDPGAAVLNITAVGDEDVFIVKLDENGQLLWAKTMGGNSPDRGSSLAVDDMGNVYTTGYFGNVADFDPDTTTYSIVSPGNPTLFLSKLDSGGNFVWAKSLLAHGRDAGNHIAIDSTGNLCLTGYFENTVDFDLGAGVYNLSSTPHRYNIFVAKYDTSSSLIWAKAMVGDGGFSQGYSTALDEMGNVFVSGAFGSRTDFDPDTGSFYISPVSKDIFILKLSPQRVVGHVYQDFNQDCVFDTSDQGIANRRLIINPGNIVVTTNSAGQWHTDYLAAGNYSITVDTAGSWSPTCPSVQNFTVVHPDSLTIAPSFGFISTSPCPAPSVTIYAPFLRPGFSNQRVYVEACNRSIGTSLIPNPSVIVTLDSALSVQSATLPFVNMGNNKYLVTLDTLIPGYCINFSFNCTLSPNSILGQTLCMEAELLPVYSCTLDSIPNPFPATISSCNTSYDNSNLSIEGTCANDSVIFYISNLGVGNMSCLTQLRLYVDGQLLLIDSIQLASNSTDTFAFTGDGRTWRLEVDQHPLHPGNSKPNNTIELCGNNNNWTSDLVNILPLNDADPNIDIYCGLVTGSYDPNDKTGYPLGIGTSNDILPNQDLEYLIRFQNTGTDTAFTIIVRDTLPIELDVFSLQLGSVSHDYNFKMYGPRILEWTFNNIMLPDSNVNEIESHGFITFKVRQAPNLPLGTTINNTAHIYFDFNAPIVTNTTNHRIALPDTITWTGEQIISVTTCDSFLFGGVSYDNSGLFWNVVNNGGLDSLHTLDITILESSENSIIESHCDFYIAPDNHVYTESGRYTAILTNSMNCDSLINIDLTIDSIPSDSLIKSGTTLTAYASGYSYQWLDCDNGSLPIIGETAQTYQAISNGNYAVIISNGNCSDTSICYNVTYTDFDIINGTPIPWSISPNPTRGKLGLYLDKIYPSVGLCITAASGDVLERLTVNNKKQLEFSVANYPSGVYFVQVQTENQIKSFKLIKY